MKAAIGCLMLLVLVLAGMPHETAAVSTPSCSCQHCCPKPDQGQGCSACPTCPLPQLPAAAILTTNAGIPASCGSMTTFSDLLVLFTTRSERPPSPPPRPTSGLV